MIGGLIDDDLGGIYMIKNKQKKVALNTTVNEEVLDKFRDYCKAVNFPMNTVLEAFMDQFSEGQFTFKLIKDKDRNRMELDVIEE